MTTIDCAFKLLRYDNRYIWGGINDAEVYAINDRDQILPLSFAISSRVMKQLLILFVVVYCILILHFGNNPFSIRRI